jgi:hypothetical protein
MIHHRCPSCEQPVASEDALAGLPIRCPHCHVSHEVPHTSESDAEPPPEKPLPPPDADLSYGPMEPKSADVTTVLAACVMFSLCFASFFSPWGWATASWIGVQKGQGYCPHPGCTRLADTRVGYTDSPVPALADKPSSYVGYCAEHAPLAPASLKNTRGRTLKGTLGFLLLAVSAIYLIWYIIYLVGVFRGEKNAFKYFALLSVAGLGLDVVAYGFWIWLAPVMNF